MQKGWQLSHLALHYEHMFKVRIWGARGSLPSPLPPSVVRERLQARLEDFFAAGNSQPGQISSYVTNLPDYKLSGFGGNTVCVEVLSDKCNLIIDAGTGIRELGLHLANSNQRNRSVHHIFFTHFHWDHIMGLPFFEPLFSANANVHFYAVQRELRDIVTMVFKKPFFPVPFESLQAQIHFHQLIPREPYQLGDLTITPYLLDHPDPCWGYRIHNGHKVYSHCVDTECARVSRKDLANDLPLYTDVDLMCFDGQYTLQEATLKAGWGHAAATIGLDLAIREKVRKIVFLHHDPSTSDFQIHRRREQTLLYFTNLLEELKNSGKEIHDLQWEFGIEGMEFEV